jgi:hypothetical protein
LVGSIDFATFFRATRFTGLDAEVFFAVGLRAFVFAIAQVPFPLGAT